MSDKGKCAIFEGQEKGDVFSSSIDYVLKGFSTKNTSSTFVYAYGHHRDLRLLGEGSIWKLHVCPLVVKDQGSKKTNFLGCSLSLESVLDVEAECTYTFGLRNPTGDSLTKPRTCYYTLGKRSGEDIGSWGLRNAFSHQDIESSMLFDDSLHIHVDIRYKIISAIERTSLDNFLKLLQKQTSVESANVLLFSSDPQEFRVHRFISSMHSAIIAAVLKNQPNGTATESWVSEDSDGGTINAMINYMYENDEWNPKLAMKMVVAAKEHKIGPLERACVVQLLKQLNIENVLEFLIIAEEHSFQMLRKKTLDFIAANMVHFCASGGLIQLRQKRDGMLKKTQEGFYKSSIDYILKGFSTKKNSFTELFAYGPHQDLRLIGEGSVWKLHVQTLEMEEQDGLKTNFLGIYLSLESTLDVEAECTYTFGIQDRFGNSLMKYGCMTAVLGKRNGETIEALGWNPFSHEDIEKCMRFDDNLHIHVDIRYKIISGGTVVKRSIPSAILVNLLQKEGSHETGDVLLISSDSKELRAHRFILSMHSTVFAAMFKHPLKETVTGICVIKDLDGATISAMIGYMYGKDEWNPKMAEKLVVAANKYKIDPLEKACVEELIKQLNFENVLTILKLADEHSLGLLQKKSLDFIAANMVLFCASGGLMQLREIGDDMLEKIQERLMELNHGLK